jgi:hypothetical protein
MVVTFYIMRRSGMHITLSSVTFSKVACIVVNTRKEELVGTI